MPSTASRLRSDFDYLIERLDDLIRDLPVKRRNRNGGGLLIIAPEFYWGEPSAEHLNRQLAIKRDYEEWFEVFQSIFVTATDDINKKIEKADKRLRMWIELSSNWSLRQDSASNAESLLADAELFRRIFSIIEAGGGDSSPILIPDTNTIADWQDPTLYRDIIGDDRFVFFLLPTVLAELDSLKNSHRNVEFREKVKKVIRRVKGWRNQGTLRDGVIVDETITVRAVANEPDMEHTLPWLDKDNRDDRIIASVLEVQSAHPTTSVILVTGDINLLNKADVARIETAEL